MSKNKAEFDVFKGLLNNSQKNTLSPEILLEAVCERCITRLGLRVMIKSRGKNIFKEPMLLITNDIITSFPQALAVYKSYLLRFKIEVVFRFLKQNLGWTSVAQNFPNQRFYLHSRFIICGVFSCGLFKELEEELKKHALCAFIRSLALFEGQNYHLFFT